MKVVIRSASNKIILATLDLNYCTLATINSFIVAWDLKPWREKIITATISDPDIELLCTATIKAA